MLSEFMFPVCCKFQKCERKNALPLLEYRQWQKNSHTCPTVLPLLLHTVHHYNPEQHEKNPFRVSSQLSTLSK